MFKEFFNYRWYSGSFAWILHRLTGLALTLYLLMHILVISTLDNPEWFDVTMEAVSSPLFKILEIGLLGCILFHAVNGIRLLIIDFGDGARYQKSLFWVFFVVIVITLAVGGYPLLMEAIHNA